MITAFADGLTLIKYVMIIIITTFLKDVIFLHCHMHTRKKNPNFPDRNRNYSLPITSSDALPLSYRRLVGAWPHFCF